MTILVDEQFEDPKDGSSILPGSTMSQDKTTYSDDQEISIGAWQGALALLLAKNRTHGDVFMDGRHNPRPTEIQKARMFIEDMIEAGWIPPDL
jgi:hypothetical protein